ncbi:MAG TPA: hypothetical protein VGY55_00605 [Pirellulales bacterium]|jgi:hypothetical protein|nr:hypothetical protein [Pirellulales bacterium]
MNFAKPLRQHPSGAKFAGVLDAAIAHRLFIMGSPIFDLQFGDEGKMSENMA